MQDTTKTQALTATKSKTPTSAPSLPAKLHDLLMSGETAIVGPQTARQLSEFAATPEPETARRDQVEVMIGKLAMATAQAKASEAEANERLELYWLALNDIPVCDLRAAFTELLKTAKFLPTPAEVRQVAIKQGASRRYAKSRARHLAWRHSVEWRPPVETIPADEVKALLASVSFDADE